MALTTVPVELASLDGAVTVNESSADADFRVESNGLSHALFVDGGNDKVIINHTTTVSQAGVAPQFQVHGTGSATSSISATRNSNDTGGPYLILSKSRGTSTGATTVVQDDDILGQIMFAGADGSDLAPVGASIQAFVDGTPGSDDMPGRLVFSTTAAGAKTATEVMRIDSNGNVGIGETSPTGTALQIRRSGAAGIVMKETGVAQFYVEQDTDAKIRWTNSNDLIFSGGANGTTEKARILNGGGLTFNGDTAAANALDDYEEGTWTPAIGSSGGSTPNYTTSVATADYVKIGKIVHASFLIVVTGVTDNGGSGNKIVTGLPFSQNQNAYQQVGVIGYNDVWGDAVDRMYITGSNLTIIPTGVTQSNYGGVITTGYFSGSITYSTDD